MQEQAQSSNGAEMQKCGQSSKVKRRVNILPPLEEGVWISAEQLDSFRARPSGESVTKRASTYSLAPASVPWAPAEAPEACENDGVRAWVEKASHWERSSLQFRVELPGLLAEELVLQSQSEPRLSEKIDDQTPDVPPVGSNRCWEESESPSVELFEGTSSAKFASGSAMSRADSCQSSRSSLSCLSREDVYNKAFQSGFPEMCRYPSSCSGGEDVHTAARRSLEEASRSSYSDPGLGMLAAHQRKEKSIRLLRFFKSSPRS